MQRLDELGRRANVAQLHRLGLARAELAGRGNRLAALNPLSILQRGYAIVTKDTQIVTSKSQVREADPIKVRVRDGEFEARVTGKE